MQPTRENVTLRRSSQQSGGKPTLGVERRSERRQRKSIMCENSLGLRNFTLGNKI